jgi:hypothetical protein
MLGGINKNISENNQNTIEMKKLTLYLLYSVPILLISDLILSLIGIAPPIAYTIAGIAFLLLVIVFISRS